jgi:hypothetical protein
VVVPIQELKLSKRNIQNKIIHQRYQGFLWQVDRIEDKAFYAWHVNADLKHLANMFGKVTVRELEEIHNKGQEALIPLSLANRNTHPMVVLLNWPKDEKHWSE